MHLFNTILNNGDNNSGEYEITIKKLIENRTLLEKAGFDMKRVIKVFKEVFTDMSGKINILEFINLTIQMRNDTLTLNPSVNMSKTHQ